MASRCQCRRLRENDFVRARLITVPLGARHVFLLLAELLEVADEPGLLRPRPSVGISALVSAWVSCSETEAETHLGALLDAGLLVEHADGAIAMAPAIRGSSRRAEAARINGLRGGRPRKHPLGPQQSTLLLPISGGAPEKPIETERAPWVSAPAAAAEDKAAAAAVDETQDDWRSVAERLGAVAGLPSGAPGADIVRTWQAAGLGEPAMLEVVHARARPGLRSLRYFDEPMRAAIARMPRPARAITGRSPAETAAREAYMADATRWWPGSGTPPPKLEDYLARARSAA